MSPSPKITPALEGMFSAFQDFLYQAAGIYFPAQRKGRLLAHVAARMEATHKADPAQYLSLLKSARGAGSERWAFFNRVTVNETYFFREDTQFAVFRDKVLPHLFEVARQERRDKINVLSAACSSGEEPYSLAILVLEAFAAESARVSIQGIDINSEVVAQARNGVYGDYAIRNCTPDRLERFFEKNGNLYQVRPELKRLVTFDVGNLADPAALKRVPRPDLILCRNALIYFDQDSKARVLANLGAVIRPQGYLFLSQTETLFDVTHPFELVHFFKVCGYRLKA